MNDPTRVQVPVEIQNESIRAFVEEWAGVTEPDRIELVSAIDDPRLLGEALVQRAVIRCQIGERHDHGRATAVSIGAHLQVTAIKQCVCFHAGSWPQCFNWLTSRTAPRSALVVIAA